MHHLLFALNAITFSPLLCFIAVLGLFVFCFDVLLMKFGLYIFYNCIRLKREVSIERTSSRHPTVVSDNSKGSCLANQSLGVPSGSLCGSGCVLLRDAGQLSRSSIHIRLLAMMQLYSLSALYLAYFHYKPRHST